MARSSVVTNRTRLDAFILAGRKIGDLVLRVGQLTGKPKYPKGHVGRKSRGPKRTPTSRVGNVEAERRKLIRAGRKYLSSITDKETRKAEGKRLRAEIKAEAARQGRKISTKGLGRKVSGPVAVARVAGVLASQSGYHIFAMKARKGQVRQEVDIIRDALLGRGSVSRALQNMGKNAKAAVRQRFIATRHVDYGHILRNIQYELVDQPTMKREAAADKARRSRDRAARKRKGKR